MEDHLERSLIELCFALADFEQTQADQRGPETVPLFVALRLSRWGLETALRALRSIEAAGASPA